MAVSIQDIRHFVMALTLSSDYGFSASLDLIGARRSSWALSLSGYGLLITTPPSGTQEDLRDPSQGIRSTQYYVPIRGTQKAV